MKKYILFGLGLCSYGIYAQENPLIESILKQQQRQAEMDQKREVLAELLLKRDTKNITEQEKRKLNAWLAQGEIQKEEDIVLPHRRYLSPERKEGRSSSSSSSGPRKYSHDDCP